MAQVAYDLSEFAPRRQEPQRRMRVVKTKKKRLRLNMRTLRRIQIVAVAFLLLTLTVGVIYSQTQLTELSAQISVQEQALVEAKSDYTYYSNQLNLRASMAAVESYATGTLGLVRVDQSQITYISTGEDNRILRDSNGLTKMADGANATALSLMEYISA